MNLRVPPLAAGAAILAAAPCRAAFSVGATFCSGDAPDVPGHAVVDDGSMRGGVGAPSGPAVGILAPMAADSDGAKGGHADSGTHSDKTSLMPGGQELKSVQLGDPVKISFQGTMIWGIAGDMGPADSSKFGEASLACIKQLGQDPKGGNTGLEGQALYDYPRPTHVKRRFPGHRRGRVDARRWNPV